MAIFRSEQNFVIFCIVASVLVRSEQLLALTNGKDQFSTLNRTKINQTSRAFSFGQSEKHVAGNAEFQSSNLWRPSIPRDPFAENRQSYSDEQPVPPSDTLDTIWRKLPQGDQRVPFWNIAHMINSISEIEPALMAGANGIETDISFDNYGKPIEAYHGFPCDCGRHCHSRENLIDFVRYVGDLTAPPSVSRLTLMIFDLKLKSLTKPGQKELAGRHLASILHENLYSRHLKTLRNVNINPIQAPPLRVIISINHVNDSALISSFLDYLHENHLHFLTQHVGFDVGMNDNLDDISRMWQSFRGRTSNIWQGDGLTNCANIVRGIDRLKGAIENRNGNGDIRKVYYWTVDIMYHIRAVLRLGIDAVLTNQPQRVVQALDEPEFKSKYRIAVAFDDPFSQYLIGASASSIALPTIDETVETVANIQNTSANFIKTLPNGVWQAIKKVHSSIVGS